VAFLVSATAAPQEARGTEGKGKAGVEEVVFSWLSQSRK